MDKVKERLLKKYICGLFLNDALGYMALLVIMLASISTYSFYMPILILGMIWMLFMFISNRRNSKLFKTDSYRITYSIARGLMLTALFAVGLSFSILGGANLSDSNMSFLSRVFYFAALYLLPALYFIFSWQNNFPNRSVFVTYTTLKYGHLFERLYLGQFIHINDKRVILYILRASSLLIFLTWGYYLFIFVDWNINSQDRIILTTVPLVVLIIGVVDAVLANNGKYTYLMAAMEGSDEKYNMSLHRVDNLCVRALLVCGNKIYIRVVNGVVDQALHVDKSIKEEYDYEYDLEKLFKLNKIANLYPLYNNEDIILGSKVERYVIFVDSEDMVEDRANCSWVEASELPYSGTMSEHFKYEWLRVLSFIITKDLFNEDGTLQDNNRKLVDDIRLLDIVDKNIDFNDIDTMKLSIFNANNPHYKFKRGWFSYVEGIID